MPLLQLWNSHRESVEAMPARQFIGTAGDGILKDDSDCSKEIREVLSLVNPETLESFAKECMEEEFTNKGFLLQDIINEIGRRLDFEVENGLYRGRRNMIGADGIWATDSGESFVVEVKTSDTYKMDINTFIRYRDGLAKEGRVSAGSPILIVVGKSDTDALECQVRGSQHAWSVRIIGVGALIKMMKINEDSQTGEVSEQIRNILRPTEYTRVDAIVDIVFTATEDEEVESNELSQVNSSPPRNEIRTVQTNMDAIKSLREQIIRVFAQQKTCDFQRKTYGKYTTSDDSYRVAVVVSKRYPRKSQQYWYAYHDSQQDFLRTAKKGYLLLGCLDRDFFFAVPFSEMEVYKSKLNQTERNGRCYRHITLFEEEGRMFLAFSPTKERLDFEQYKVPLLLSD